MRKMTESWVSKVASRATTVWKMVAIVSLLWNMEGINAVTIKEGKVYFFKSTAGFKDALFMLEIQFSSGTVEKKQVKDRDFFWSVDDYKTISKVTIIGPVPHSSQEYRHEYSIKHPEVHSGKDIVTWIWTWDENGIKVNAYDEDNVQVANTSITVELDKVTKYQHDD